MKQMLLGYEGSEEEGASVVIEWDIDKGTLDVSMGGYKRSMHSLRMKLAVEGGGYVHWQGENFAITRIMHSYFLTEYPGLNLESYYMAADEWCTIKNKKIKRPQQFMNNWLAKTRKGKKERGGVIY